jgi:hypothetical protein
MHQTAGFLCAVQMPTLQCPPRAQHCTLHSQAPDFLWPPFCCSRTASVPRLPPAAVKAPADPPAAAAVEETVSPAAVPPQPQPPATPHSRLSPVSARSQVPPLQQS